MATIHQVLKVGLTGGIGTGKSTIAKIFETFGIPVLDADAIAKRLMNKDEALKQKLIMRFGTSIYENGRLQNKVLAGMVFNDPAQLDILNSIIHPATIQYASEWMSNQNSPYAIKEAAIMVETGSYKELDFLIGVAAELPLRIERTMLRDRVSREEVMARIARQMDNEEKMTYCKYVIQNNNSTSLIEQCLHIHQDILKKIN